MCGYVTAVVATVSAAAADDNTCFKRDDVYWRVFGSAKVATVVTDRVKYLLGACSSGGC
jgi:hypothetical protein